MRCYTYDTLWWLIYLLSPKTTECIASNVQRFWFSADFQNNLNIGFTLNKRDNFWLVSIFDSIVFSDIQRPLLLLDSRFLFMFEMQLFYMFQISQSFIRSFYNVYLVSTLWYGVGHF